MAVEYEVYRPKRIPNKHKRPDHWFWTRYAAHPYIGCQHGCEYCHWRESKYCPYPDPEDFSSLIKVKINAPELLRKELSKVPVGGIVMPVNRLGLAALASLAALTVALVRRHRN